MEPLRYDDMIPGCYDPRRRVEDMDVDGVQAACCFPSFPGFAAGGSSPRPSDKDLALACVAAWNDFSIDEWCAIRARPLHPAGDAAVSGTSMAASPRSERVAAKAGAKGVTFPDSRRCRSACRRSTPTTGNRSGTCSKRPTSWSACTSDRAASSPGSRLPQDASPGYRGGEFKSVSARTGGNAEIKDDDAPTVTSFAVYATNLMWTASDLVFSGQLQKHPRLKFMLAEGGIGWFPYIWERMDQVWARHRYYQPIDFDARPSDLFKKHFWGCYIEDEFGIKNRHEIGIDRICVEIDYPHSDSNWPNSRKGIAVSLAEVPDDEAHRIVELNAREVLNFPRS